MRTVLSTKKLLPHQKELLLNKGIGLVEYDAINIEFLDFQLEKVVENAIITSQNSAKAIINNNINIENCFCVGEKTANYLENNNYSIKEVASYGEDLAEVITKKYHNIHFTFFCGESRRVELPNILKENNIPLNEIRLYKTHLNSRFFPQEFDGIMFFSPSAVKSFVAKNELRGAIAFCIGNTTEIEVLKHTNNILTATKPSIENVIVQVVKTYSKND